MAVERHFIGWDEPLTAGVRRFLIPAPPRGPVDMGDCLVVVPTRQAGRKLRETLALYASGQNTAILSLRAVTPAFFLHPERPARPVAGPAMVKAVWADLLRKVDPARYAAFLANPPPARDFAWAVHTGEMLQSLRHTLAEGGFRIADVPAACAGDLEEADRWDDMARLESLFLHRLQDAGFDEPIVGQIAQAEHPTLPDGIARIVLAGVPDPTPLALRALKLLSRQTSVHVLVGAPAELADAFDDWGRPIPARWQAMPLDIPAPERNVLLAASPRLQSVAALHEMATHAARMGPADAAIGVPDREVIPFLEADLALEGLPAYDPADRRLADHSLALLLRAWCELGTEGSYDALRAFLRHPDILDFLARQRSADDNKPADIPSLALLTELDEFQNYFLPANAQDVLRRLAGPGAASHKSGMSDTSDYQHLAAASAFIRNLLDDFERRPFDAAARAFLQTVYHPRTLRTHNADDHDFKQAAAVVDGILRDMTAMKAFGPGPGETALIFLRLLAEGTYHREREDAVIDLHGWLELPWVDAPFLCVTGMNEGIVPDTRLGDVFLPDSLRARLGLACDDTRMARDLFLMRLCIESRRDGGRVCFMAGKASSAGDPLRPSRLLLRCPDKELPLRAARLFGPLEEVPRVHAATVSFKLDPASPHDARLDLRTISVTAFRDYLACPFRYYLKRVLRMEEMDDLQRDMDPADFGSMIHDVLASLSDQPKLREDGDPETLAQYFAQTLEAWIRGRFGASPPLPVVIAADSARERLRAAATVQAALAREGWESLAFERTYETTLAGITLRGKIDRVDRNRETGALRLIDYKTSDRDVAPDAAHLRSAREDTPAYAQVMADGKARRWADLQLPLYRLLIAGHVKTPGAVELAYFNLPKAVSHTGLACWDGFSDAMLASARDCAEAVIERIRGRVFWPPAERVEYDDFERLYAGTIDDSFTPLAIPGGS